jgi:hypothetical protein
MVSIVEIKEIHAKKGNFKVLVLQGNLEVAISKTTGRPYLTARKANIPYTFSDGFANSLIGTQLPGEIERIECAEYEFTIPSTKKKIKISHRFQYCADATVLEEVVG